MRILYLMTEPFGIGGVQSDLLALSEDLTRRGHQVFVATTEGVLLDDLKRRGATHVDIDFHFDGAGGLLRAMRALRRAVKAHAIELVAPQSVRSTLAAWAALRLPPWPRAAARLPIVTTVHNIHDPRTCATAARLLQWCSDHVIFESHFERDRLLALGLDARRTSVVHSGIDLSTFTPRPYDDAVARRHGLVRGAPLFGIVARLSEEKGHGHLLRAFARVHAQVPQARLLVVGDGPLAQELVQLSQALGLGDAVVFTGLQRDIPGYLSVMDVFVLSSTRESFPLAAREAMAAGLPVIAPRIGGCPEVVAHGSTGYLFEAGRDDELAARMLDLLDGGRRAAFGRAARARVERRFSRQAWVEGDERVYCAWLPAPAAPAATAAAPSPAQAAAAAPSAPMPLH